MHILKIKGKAKIPDYIQIRDDDFTLKAYFRVDRPEKSLEKIGGVSASAKAAPAINSEKRQNSFIDQIPENTLDIFLSSYS